jgi:hypothetical protein
MPDKYGFETEDDRREQEEQRKRDAEALREAHVELQGRLNESVRDVLQHFVNAMGWQHQLDVMGSGAPPGWAVGAPNQSQAGASMRVVITGDASAPQLALWVHDPGGGAASHLQTLVQVLERETGISTRRVDRLPA